MLLRETSLKTRLKLKLAKAIPSFTFVWPNFIFASRKKTHAQTGMKKKHDETKDSHFQHTCSCFIKKAILNNISI